MKNSYAKITDAHIAPQQRLQSLLIGNLLLYDDINSTVVFFVLVE